jgi:glycosyltransferase involved in cell wall biosynthesis
MTEEIPPHQMLETGIAIKPLHVMQLGSPTGLYGAERWILALIRHLDRSMVDSIVGVIRDDPQQAAPLCAEARRLGFRAHVFDAPGRVNWSAVHVLREYLRNNQVHILHTHGYKTDLIGWMATCGTSCRLVSTPHGWSTQAGLKLRIYEAIDRAAFPFFDAVAPLSDTLYNELERWPGLRGKLHLIRNGVDVLEIDSIREPKPGMTPHGRREFVVGYVGQLIARKGLDVLLRAFAQLSLPNKKLVLIGEGPQRQDLTSLSNRLGISECVEFHGFRDDRLSLLKNFDVFVLPSRLEGVPRCLMEAMAAGTPVVASDIPGCTDLVKHNDSGLLFRCDNVEELLACLEGCLEPQLRARIVRNAREFVVANFSADTMARRYGALYGSLIN